MSLNRITRIGLYAQQQDAMIAKNLLSLIFRRNIYTEKPTHTRETVKNVSLFPKIDESSIINLANSVRGLAIACAADDLELSFNGESGQIEIYDNFVPGNPKELFNDEMHYTSIKNTLNQAHFPYLGKSGPPDLGSSYHSSNYGVDDYSPTSLSSGYSQTFRFPFETPDYSRNGGTAPVLDNEEAPDFELDFMGPHQSHYNILAAGSQLDTQFTDFKRPSFNDVSSCGSSIESFDSPLDEMFIPRPSAISRESFTQGSNIKKRKPEDAIQQFNIQSNVFGISHYEGQKKLKRESESHFQPVRPHDKEHSKSQPNLFYGSNSMKFSSSIFHNIESKPVKLEDEEKDKARYICNDCDAAFKVKSYLTRHIRKHNNAKAFVCPFYREQDSEFCGTSKSGTKCHPTGGFSRKDTYKTHLKALHFIYPPRTKSSERCAQGGRCAGCFQYFESNADWFKSHIEEGTCKGFSNNTGASVMVKEEQLD